MNDNLTIDKLIYPFAGYIQLGQFTSTKFVMPGLIKTIKRHSSAKVNAQDENLKTVKFVTKSGPLNFSFHTDLIYLDRYPSYNVTGYIQFVHFETELQYNKVIDRLVVSILKVRNMAMPRFEMVPIVEDYVMKMLRSMMVKSIRYYLRVELMEKSHYLEHFVRRILDVEVEAWQEMKDLLSQLLS